MDVRPENAIRDLQELKDEAWTAEVSMVARPLPYGRPGFAL